MNPYVSASKLGPPEGQDFAVMAYQIEDQTKAANTQPVRGTSETKSSGAVGFFGAYSTHEEAMLFADYLQQQVKIPGIVIAGTGEFADMHKYKEDDSTVHEPITSTRTLMEKHGQDMQWFHPSYQVRTNARLISMLKERATDSVRQLTYQAAEVVEWRNELTQLQAMIRDLSEKASRTERELRKLDASEWGQEEEDLLSEHVDEEFLASLKAVIREESPENSNKRSLAQAPLAESVVF